MNDEMLDYARPGRRGTHTQCVLLWFWIIVCIPMTLQFVWAIVGAVAPTFVHALDQASLRPGWTFAAWIAVILFWDTIAFVLSIFPALIGLIWVVAYFFTNSDRGHRCFIWSVVLAAYYVVGACYMISGIAAQLPPGSSMH